MKLIRQIGQYCVYETAVNVFEVRRGILLGGELMGKFLSSEPYDTPGEPSNHIPTISKAKRSALLLATAYDMVDTGTDEEV